MLNALTLLAEGTSNRPGLGDLMAVDVGGATTDVYSIARGLPTSPATMLHGLREPRVKRTVEGDIGMRYGASGVAEAAGMDALSEVSGLPAETITRLLHQIQGDPSLLPQGDELSALDYALAVLAVRTGLIRHAGTLTQVYTPMGAVYRQEGKDLTEISRMVVTGGTLIYSGRSQDIVKTALQGNDPSALLPRDPMITVDHQYILASMGLLAGYDQAAALDILLQQFGKDVDNAAGQ
ncbi:MAG: glutamate mutase L [Christensenellales bacterium]